MRVPWARPGGIHGSGHRWVRRHGVRHHCVPRRAPDQGARLPAACRPAGPRRRRNDHLAVPGPRTRPGPPSSRHRAPARGPQVTRAPCRRGIRTDSAVRATGLAGKGEADRRPACPAGARPAGASGEECPERSCESGYAGHVLPGSRRHPAVPHLVRHARIRVRVGFDGRYGLLGAHGPTAGSAQKRHPAPPAPLPRPAPRHRPPPLKKGRPAPPQPAPALRCLSPCLTAPSPSPASSPSCCPHPRHHTPSAIRARPRGPGAVTRDQGRRAGGVHGSMPPRPGMPSPPAAGRRRDRPPSTARKSTTTAPARARTSAGTGATPAVWTDRTKTQDGSGPPARPTPSGVNSMAVRASAAFRPKADTSPDGVTEPPAPSATTAAVMGRGGPAASARSG